MKKLLFASLLAITLSSFIKAQKADVSFVINDKKAKAIAGLQIAEPNASAVSVTAINTKAEKDFSRSCKNAEKVHWYPDDNGSFVYYSVNEKNGRRFYDKKGELVYEILSYNEEGLPFDIRDRVKQAYYLDYNITHVQEIHIERKIIYMVQIEDKTTWKQVRICDDELDVVAEIKIKQ